LLARQIVRYLLALALALSSVACNDNGSDALPSPTTLQAVNAVCGTQITALNLDADYSGPHLLIDVAFASVPAPVEIEIEEYQPDGSTSPFTVLSNVVGRASVALHFNTKYRGRARAGGCDWSPWVDKQIGPPNPCGDCLKVPPPPPSPPAGDDCKKAHPFVRTWGNHDPPTDECKER
jgi:hypothetical protein